MKSGMKLISSILVILPFGAPIGMSIGNEQPTRYQANIDAVNIDNKFNQRNPHFKQRAGAFYEITHIAKAAEQFFAYSKIKNQQKPLSLEILRAFSYDCLDSKVRSNGVLNATDHARHINTMDSRFRKLLNQNQFSSYLIWRNLKDRDQNAFEFFTRNREK